MAFVPEQKKNEQKSLEGTRHTRELGTLAQIWRRVLGKDAIKSDDNFFDLGGNPPRAHALFAEIARQFGRELCPLLIFQAPTISQLAAIIEQAEPPEVAPLVLLKKGSNGPPLFLAHGLGSTVMDLYPLVQHLQGPFPIYGMQASGIDGRRPPLRRIEEMAEYHLDSIRKLQPHGPYFLIGYSLGGLICIEIARRLANNGQRVALLAALDSWPDIRHLRFRERIRLTVQRNRERIVSLLRTDTYRANWPGSKGALPDTASPEMTRSMAVAFEQVKAAQYEAHRAYKPSFYDGKMIFVRAGTVFHFPNDSEAVWKHLAREFELHSVPCDHPSMLTTHADALGKILTECLRLCD